MSLKEIKEILEPWPEGMDLDWEKDGEEYEKVVARLHTYTHGILDTVLKHWDYFKENPKHLAWAMMQYELTHRACNMAGPGKYGCMDNSKYPIIDLGNEHLSESDSNLFYDAWGVTISNDFEFPDCKEGDELAAKKNKTVQDWIKLKTSDDYRYRDLYNDDLSIINRLLFGYGGGMDWNEDGYIDNVSPSGVGESIFAGYTRAENEIRDDIKEEIMSFAINEDILYARNRIWKEHLFRHNASLASLRIIESIQELKRDFNRRGDKINVDEDKAIEATMYLLHFQELVNSAKKWTPEKWKEMQQKTVVDINGFKMKVSEFRGDFTYPVRYGTYRFRVASDVKDFLDLRIDNVRYICQLNWLKEKIKELPGFDYKPYIEFMLAAEGSRGWGCIKSIIMKDAAKKASYEKMYSLISNDEHDEHDEQKYSRYRSAQMSEYSPVCNMPENAHQSYVDEAIKHLRLMIKDPLLETCEYSSQNITYAFKLLQERFGVDPFDENDSEEIRAQILEKKKVWGNKEL